MASRGRAVCKHRGYSQRAVARLQDEAAFHESCTAHLKDYRASARTSQLYAAFIDHPHPKMSEMGELAVSKLQVRCHQANFASNRECHDIRGVVNANPNTLLSITLLRSNA
jgi:hypothetical protein